MYNKRNKRYFIIIIILYIIILNRLVSQRILLHTQAIKPRLREAERSAAG